MYKFKYPNDTAICKQEPPVDSCDESKSFTCSYTPTTPMTEKFRFFAQANCDMDTKEFTVNIAGTTYVVYNSVNVCNIGMFKV